MIYRSPITVSQLCNLTMLHFHYIQHLTLPQFTATRYRIQYTTPDWRFPNSRILHGNGNEYTLPWLQIGTNYTITVRVEVQFTYCSTHLYGEYSTPVYATTMETGEYIREYGSTFNTGIILALSRPKHEFYMLGYYPMNKCRIKSIETIDSCNSTLSVLRFHIHAS